MNWSLFSLPNTNRKPKGYSLTELSVVLGLVAIAASWAAPQLSHWLWRWRVETVVQAWSGDLRAAQLQALRRGQNLQLQRLNGCQTAPLADGDWRCGWQLAWAADSTKGLQTNALDGALRIQLYPSNNLLTVDGQGELLAGGLRLTVQAKSLTSVVRSICINTTGRMRVVAAEVCT
jgi:prepilin-type N-terminal cleavage/methylation domain-containing protein